MNKIKKLFQITLVKRKQLFLSYTIKESILSLANHLYIVFLILYKETLRGALF